MYNAYYNPSILPFTYDNIGGLNINYLPFTNNEKLNDIFYLSLAGFYKTNAKTVVSSTLRFSNFGRVNLISETLEALGVSNPFNLAYDLSYSKKITPHLSLGVTGRYILNYIAPNAYNNNIDVVPSHSVAADISLSYLKILFNNDALYTGISLSNLGTTFGARYTYDYKNYLPANLSIGASYNKFINRDNLVSLSLELNKLLVPLLFVDGVTGKVSKDYESMNVFQSYYRSLGDNPDGFLGELGEFSVGIGLEWVYNDMFIIRGGYLKDAKTTTGNQVFSCGFGLKTNSNFEIDLSYSVNTVDPYILQGTPFNNAFRFGIIFNKLGSYFDADNSSVKCVSPN